MVRRLHLRSAAAAALAGAIAALAAPGPAPAASGGAATFRDRVFEGPVARPSTARTRALAATFRTPDGIGIYVTVSDSVPNPQVVAQEIVNFLGSRLHGAELGRLLVHIGTPAEINSRCGGAPGVLACYSIGERRMYVPSVDPGGGGPFTRDYAITHEYGHHIAAFRSNYPFQAIHWGAKYWASSEFVCAGVARGIYFPGNQRERYLDNPGEAFADTYAHLYYPDVVWQYNESLRPDAVAFDAVRRDVLQPWTRHRRRVVRGSLNARRRGRAFSVRTALDGVIEARLSGPLSANFDLGIYAGRRLVTRSRRPGSTEQVSVLACRDGSRTAGGLAARVSRRRGAGRFRLTILYPG
jgi:hypothetical protein